MNELVPQGMPDAVQDLQLERVTAKRNTGVAPQEMLLELDFNRTARTQHADHVRGMRMLLEDVAAGPYDWRVKCWTEIRDGVRVYLQGMPQIESMRDV